MNTDLSRGAHRHLKSASGFQFTFVWVFWLYVCVSRSVVSDSFATPWTVAHQTLLSGILQARILEVLISFSLGPSQPRIKPRSFTVHADFFYHLNPQGSHSVVQNQENANWQGQSVICYWYSLPSICLKGQCMPTISFISDTFIRSSIILRNGRRNWTLRSALI